MFLLSIVLEWNTNPCSLQKVNTLKKEKNPQTKGNLTWLMLLHREYKWDAFGGAGDLYTQANASSTALSSNIFHFLILDI